MSDAAAYFSTAQSAEQGAIGVQTGFCEPEAIDFLGQIAAGWKEAWRLDIVLLRALCQLSSDGAEPNAGGFTAWDLVEAISKIRGRPWSDSLDKEKMSDDVRSQWKKLQSTWDVKLEGMIQQFSDRGISRIPRLAKAEGGGTGRATFYRIEWIDSEIPVEAKTQPPAGHIGEPTILRYRCEDIEEAGPIAGLFARGIQLRGWRRQLYIVCLGAPIVFICVLLLQLAFGIFWIETIGAKSVLMSLLSLLVTFGAVRSLVGQLFKIGDDEIVIAPWWMQSVDNDWLLERRVPPRFQDRTIKAVRYVASCPICANKVAAKAGRLEFFGRIVGRCEAAPVEHVFSFDHVTRRGKPLR